MIVIAGSASPQLAERVASELECKLAIPELRRFPDGEVYARVQENLKGESVAVVQSTCNPQDGNYMELFMLLDVAKDLGAERVTAVIPYFGYARQDSRFEPGEAVSIQTIRKLIEAAGADEVITVDAHKAATMDLFNIPAKTLSARPVLGEHLKSLKLEKPVILAPDKGALGHAELAAKELGADFDHLVKKRKSATEVSMETKELDVKGRDVAIVDDIISTGGTVVEAIRVLKEQGAGKIYAGCVHPVLVGDALVRIREAGAEDVFATDTIEHEVSVVSVGPIIADALR